MRRVPPVVALALVATTLVGAGACFNGCTIARVESFAHVRERTTRSESVLLDRSGEPLHELRVDSSRRRLGWVPLGRVSEALREAVLRSEDRRFRTHGGVDWRAILAASAQNLVRSQKRGASTITMQLAGLLFERGDGGSRAPGRRGWWAKARQIARARAIERGWSKDEILEAYLNLVSFRGELQGIAAASEGLFGRAPHGLGVAESAILAALIRSPGAGAAALERRACALSSAEWPVDCARVRELLAGGALDRPRIRPAYADAPHAARRLLAESGGSGRADRGARHERELRSTLDGALQRRVAAILRHQLLSLRSRNAHDAAALVVDNATGEVLAYVGGLDDLATDRFVDGIQARRQAGSTLKPLLYGLGIDQRLLTAASRIDDSPLEIQVANGVYRPQNFDREFHGEVSVRTALASSLNVPAVKVLGLVGVDRFVRFLRDSRFSTLERDDFYGPSLALGAVDVKLWDLVQAYWMLARGGEGGTLRLSREAQDSAPERRILSSEAAYVVSSILSDRASREMTFGLENPLASRYWTAVKTGTSKDMRDNWCVGFSDRYTVGVWVGNSSGAPMWNVTGITGAAPVWAEVMGALHRSVPSRAPTTPARVVAVGNPREYYIQGTQPGSQPTEPGNRARTSSVKIIYPGEELIIALDPDIPEENQKVFFESSRYAGDIRWILDGKDLGAASRRLGWSPGGLGARGTHRLALVDRDGMSLDSVSFSVK